MAQLRNFTIVSFVLGLTCGCCVFMDVYLRRSEPTIVEIEIRHVVAVYERPPTNRPVGLDCRDSSTVLRLVFIVMSSPNKNGTRRRSAARHSWPLKTIYKPTPAVHVTLKFVLGTLGLRKSELQKLIKEQDTFGDLLLLENHRDVYGGLTEKVRRGVKWADENVQFDYLIKTDDDVIVQLDNMTAELRRMGCPRTLYWGNLIDGAFIKHEGKWKETKWIVCETYLPYATGNGYVLGQQLVHSVMSHDHWNNLSHFNSEDVSMGLWLAPYRHVVVASNARGFALIPSCSTVTLAHFGSDIARLERATQAMLKKGKMC